MIRHADAWAKIGAVELEEGEGYNNVTVEVTTVGGVNKLVRLSESEASWLVAQMTDALACRPADTRVETFKASIRGKGKPAPLKG